MADMQVAAFCYVYMSVYPWVESGVVAFYTIVA